MKTYKLEYPFTYGNREVTEVQYPERVRAALIRRVNMQKYYEGGEIINFVSACINEPVSFCDEIDYIDLMQLYNLINSRGKPSPVITAD